MSNMISSQNKKRVLGDIVLNIFASSMPLIILQLYILPRLAADVGETQYGQIVTLTSVFLMVSGAFGGALNNSRLISNNLYETESIRGDYNLLIIGSLVLSAVIVLAITFLIMPSIGIIVILLLLIISSLNLLINYGTVGFRLNLNYKSIFINSVVLGVGYLLGYLLYRSTGEWFFIYICGYVASAIYIYSCTNLAHDGVAKTKLFPRTARQVLILVGSGLLVSSSAYLDKIMLFPVLGGEQVAVYYSATVLPKMMSLAIDPIAGVSLSYFAKIKRFDRKAFTVLIVLVMILGIIGYLIILVISAPILVYLYPQYHIQATTYIPITTLTAVLIICGNLINMIILRFRPESWQLSINGAYLIAYISLGLLGYYWGGLIGFCLGLCISAGIKILLLLFAYKKGGMIKSNGG